jgi:transposase
LRALGHEVRLMPAQYVKAFLAFFSRLPPCLVGLEACARAHYWARESRALRHEVRLMPAQYVKAYRFVRLFSARRCALCRCGPRNFQRANPVGSNFREPHGSGSRCKAPAL